jgi:hypothetical protein
MRTRLTSLLLAAFLIVGAGVVAAQSETGLSKKEAAKALKDAGKALGQAQREAERGNGQAAAARAQEYAATLQQLGRGMGNAGRNENEALEIAEQVHDATLKHIPVLEGVLARVPDQAKPAIERALAASQRGNTEASQAILRNSAVNLGGQSLDNRSARGAMKKNEALVKLAEASAKRNDRAALDQAAEQYSNNVNTIGRAVQNGQVHPNDQISVLDTVSSNTQRHAAKLEELLDTVPEQARPGIERAIANSQRGHQAATAALQRSRAADRAAGRGRPDGVGGGPPSGVGGRPAGVGGPPSGAGGPPAGTAGPPAGRPGRP